MERRTPTARWRAGSIALSMLLSAAMVPLPVAAKSKASKSSKSSKKSKRKSRSNNKNRGPKVTPESAAADRDSALEIVSPLLESDPNAAGTALDVAAAEKGDPVLYLEAADAYLSVATDSGDLAYVEAARQRAHISLDILYFHLDDSSDDRFQLVSKSEVPGLIDRAEEVLAEADRAASEIEAALAGPDLDEEDDGDETRKKRKPRKPGRAMIIGGASMASVGGALLVMGVAGLGVGAARQQEAQDPAVYGGSYDEVDQKGRRANVVAGVGLGLGAALVGAGVALVFLGRKRKKEAAQDDTMVRVGPRLDRHGGGVSLSGRF